jgi:hypothetical protein
MAWIIYALIALAVAAILVLFVARDNEERFFYGLMPTAGAYVLRPTEKYMAKLVYKFTGVSRPEEAEKQEK